MQNEITSTQRLLDKQGNIANPGFAKKLYWQYDRKDIKAPKWRIKEWDYYYIGNQDYGLALTISDSGYVANISISLLSYVENNVFQLNDSCLGFFPLGKMKLPFTSEQGDIKAKLGRAEMTFLNDGKIRHLKGKITNFAKTNKELNFDLVLSDIPKESMVIATPFTKNKHFYYNQKINCMKVDGKCNHGDKTYIFSSNNQSLATLDWGRGVWTYDNTWYWGSGQMYLENNHLFGFNIGYGFGNTSMASENMLFYDGKAHKLDEVKFIIPKLKNGKYDYLKPWTFSETNKRFEMTFVPIIDRNAKIDIGLLAMIPHQVFGLMNGKAILDDGTIIEIKNKLVFAEHVHNKW